MSEPVTGNEIESAIKKLNKKSFSFGLDRQNASFYDAQIIKLNALGFQITRKPDPPDNQGKGK